MSTTVEDAATRPRREQPTEPGPDDATVESGVAAKRPRRYPSLDAARGLMLISSLATASLLPPRGYQWEHSPWLGVRLYDLIFPVFVTLSGVGLAFANKGRPSLLTTLRRGLTLIVVGLVYNAISNGWSGFPTLRITGTLTAYGFLVLFVGVIHRWVRTWWAWAALTAVWGTAVTTVVARFQANCPSGVLTPDCNLSRALDPLVFGAHHLYNQGALGHDPEGVVSLSGLFLTAFVGITAGHILLASKGSAWTPLRLLAWLGVVLGSGVAAEHFVEPFKRQWTPSFALMTAVLGLALLLLTVVAFDQPRARPARLAADAVAWPLVALGRNSLLMYFGSHAFVEAMLRSNSEWNPTAIAERLHLTLWGRPDAGFILLNVAAWWLLAIVLHAAGIYVTAGGVTLAKRRTPRTARSSMPQGG